MQTDTVTETAQDWRDERLVQQQQTIQQLLAERVTQDSTIAALTAERDGLLADVARWKERDEDRRRRYVAGHTYMTIQRHEWGREVVQSNMLRIASDKSRREAERQARAARVCLWLVLGVRR